MNKLLIYIGFLLWGSIAYSQQVSLEEALESAIKKNPTLENIQLDQQADLLTIHSAKTANLPKVSLSAMGLYAFDNLINGIPFMTKPIDNAYMMGVNVVQPIYLGGKIKISNDLAKLQSEVTTLKLTQSQDSIRLMTKNKFWNIVRLQEQITVLDKQLDYVKHLEKQLNDLLKAGLIARNDLLKVTVKRSNILLNQSKLDNGRKVALLDFSFYTGIPYREELHLLDDPQQQPLSEIRDSYNSQHPLIELLNKNIEAQHLLVKDKKTALKPQVFISLDAMQTGSFNNSLPGNFVPMVLGGVSIPLSSLWSKENNDVKHQQIEVKKAENNLKTLKDQLSVQYKSIQLGIEDAYKQIDFAEENKRATEENLKVIRDNYSSGFATLTEVMEAQTMVQQAQFEKVEAFIHLQNNFANYDYLLSTGH